MSYRQLEKVLRDHGWRVVKSRNKRSGHRYYGKEGFPDVPIPVHGGNKDLGKLALDILKQAGIKLH